VIVRMFVVAIVVMRRFVVMFGGVMFGDLTVMFGVVAVFVVVAIRGVSVRILRRFRCLGGRILDDVALNAFTMAASARAAVARTAAAGTVFRVFLGLAMGALVGFDQCLTVGDGNLVIVGMNFAEGEKTVTVAAIFDEGRLQRRFDPRDLGQIDIAAQLFALRSLEVKLFDAIAADHDDPGFLRVGGIDKHLVGHFGTLDGGWRAGRRAHIARPGDATVHLIRG
jgi:hypothetical protein